MFIFGKPIPLGEVSRATVHRQALKQKVKMMFVTQHDGLFIFQRKLDFYTASFATIVGLAGLLFTATKKNSSTDISIIVGIGIGIVTTFYGIYMIWTAQEQKNNQFAN